MTTISNQQKKRFRAIGHHLRPAVTIGSKGLTDSVLSEVDRALHDHELIKIKLKMGDRDSNKSTLQQLIGSLSVSVIQTIGNTALLYMPAEKPDPKLSNILRSDTSL
ncbi:MAG: YhbY family RNA-binding protein [Pseudomonadales bacterium]|jgi:RNA-binding protein|nr:YhbY family RNA-binding protein [Pseudomonadales bacterium]MDP7359584.1 YhbY family RNA-binding protein [Pseudomonadales bacterium]MDP7595815.1 YhbY family RNA-binding protein [Pseudomonadales bacterium]HJN49953.1 YhbY family RNA-binding protein [Pseudomonadales bacterium]|tara:strand:- start:6312 stop:6632 length:321 start_codon:yes stop_codon:yes gene_type:complete